MNNSPKPALSASEEAKQMSNEEIVAQALLPDRIVQHVKTHRNPSGMVSVADLLVRAQTHEDARARLRLLVKHALIRNSVGIQTAEFLARNAIERMVA